MTELTRTQNTIFESIKLTRPDGSEYWSARDLMPLLGYEKWERFADAVDRARTSLVNIEGETAAQDHFPGAGKMVGIGAGASRRIEDIHLSRYSCYLVAMNGDPRKPQIAAAQSYFAIRTRQAETSQRRELSRLELIDLAREAEVERIAAAARAAHAEATVVALTPKAEAHDAYLTASGGARLLREAARIFRCREIQLRRFLIDEGLIYPRAAPCGVPQYNIYASARKHFQASETVVRHGLSGRCSHYTVRILPSGIDLVHRRLAAAGTGLDELLPATP